ncbi:hypothetical protein BDN72DRAFT_903792 [Pluteus cervinus]|uniref:Uncharacterized protein n=1 Tax=Pluteus cervinus TaxID=181527 RepID=A0ACD3A808_9AGAR|nr:hypothetical protein BDN72DRAFT_903792 [Pluteus cervinus]
MSMSSLRGLDWLDCLYLGVLGAITLVSLLPAPSYLVTKRDSSDFELKKGALNSPSGPEASVEGNEGKVAGKKDLLHGVVSLLEALRYLNNRNGPPSLPPLMCGFEDPTSNSTLELSPIRNVLAESPPVQIQISLLLLSRKFRLLPHQHQLPATQPHKGPF